MQPCPYPITELVPHEAPMLLLDEVIECDITGLTAAVTIGEGSVFLEPGGVPAHIGLEYMAQACGAYAGVLAREAGRAVNIGFLLGTRRYIAHVPWYRRGQRLMVHVKVLYNDEQMGAFDCRIEIDGVLAADAQLSVYQPDELPTKLGDMRVSS